MYEAKSMEKRAGKKSSEKKIHGEIAQNKKRSRESGAYYEKIIEDTAIQMRQIGADYETSRDVAHEAFAETYERHQQGEVNNFKSYMFISAKNLLFKTLKRSKRFVENADDYLFIDVERNDPLTEFLKKESSVLLLEAISMLPEEDRNIIEMDMMDVPHVKIGKELRMSNSCVGTRKHRILQQLKSYFEKTPENYTEDKLCRNMRTLGIWLKRGEITRYMYKKMASSLFRKQFILETIKHI